MASSNGRGTSLNRPAWVPRPSDTAPVGSSADTNPNPLMVPERKGEGNEFVQAELPSQILSTDMIVNEITGSGSNQTSSNPAIVNDWLPARAPNGATYWYSRSTGQTTWKDPQLVAADEPMAASAAVGTNDLKQICLQPTSASAVGTMQDPAANLSSATQVETFSGSAAPSVAPRLSPTLGPTSTSNFVPKSELELEPTFETPTTMWRAIRTENGRVYYHDRVSNRTQWERPENLKEDGKSISDNVELAVVERTEKSGPSANPNSAVVLHPPLSISTEANLGTDAGAYTVGPSSTSSLPEGWSQYRTPDGRAYYYHAVSRETRWDPPTFLGSEPKHAAPSTSAVLNSPRATMPSSMPTLKRPVAERLGDPQGDIPDTWIGHLTPEGRQYYFNPRTRATSWSLPPGATVTPTNSSALSAVPSAQAPDENQSTRLKRARAESPIHTSGPAKRKVGPTRRPRDAEDNPMTDRAAEAYFLKRAEILQMPSTSDSDVLMVQTGVRGGKGLASVPAETQVEKTQAFYTMLEEAGITAATPWLDVMARCAGDFRYTDLEKYGIRKDTWHKYQAKYERLSRRAGILDYRKKAARLIECLEEHVVDVDDRVLTLHHCPPRVIQDVEEDPRFKGVSDPTRASLIKAFFAKRARLSAALRARRRKDILAQMTEALDHRIDPALKESEHGNEGKIDPKEEKGVIEAGNVKVKADAINIGNINERSKGDGSMQLGSKFKESGQNEHIAPNNRSSVFTERTAYRDLDQFLQSIEGYGDVSSEDVSDVIHRWQRRMDMLCEERAAREHEMRKAKLRENRAMFRHGVLDMILHGKVPFTARWKEVSDMVGQEDFAKPEVELGCRPANLFEDGLRLFEERVQKRRDEFKRLIKESGADVNNQTTLDTLSSFPVLKSFLGDMEKPIAHALLVDRQRKENKRRMKERERLAAQFRQIIISSDLPSNAKFEDCVGQWTELPVYKQLTAIGAQDTMQRVFDEHFRFRRSKDDRDRRLKRKLELDDVSTGVSLGKPPANLHGITNVSGAPETSDMSGISRAPGMDVLSGASSFTPHDRMKRLRVSGIGTIGEPSFSRAVSRDEETGWAAVVSEKQLTDEQKAADRERRKQEILKSYESGKSTAHSQV